MKTMTYLAVVGALSAAGMVLAEPMFQGTGALPASHFGSRARDISEDGTAVLGNSDEGASSIAFRWQAGAITSLGHLSSPIAVSEAGGISSDGSIVAGMSFSSNGTEAFRWESGNMVGLGSLPTGDFYSHAFEISGDGTKVVGLSRTEVADFPFVWQGGVMSNLSLDFPGEVPPGAARSISDDGHTIVGTIATSQGERIFRWQDGDMEAIEYPEGSQFAFAVSVSADGSVILGSVKFSSAHSEGFRWENGVYEFLGDLAGGDVNSGANDTSADGSVIVGSATNSNGFTPFIWDAMHGMRDLNRILRHDYDLDLEGWRLDDAVAVSGDGLAVTGNGINPAGKFEAWIARICGGTADLDADGNIDAGDRAAFADCTAGPVSAPDPTSPQLSAQDCLDTFDLNCNGVVDLADSAIYQRIFRGPAN